MYLFLWNVDYVMIYKILIIYLWILLPVKKLKKGFVTEAQTHRNPSYQTAYSTIVLLLLFLHYSVYNMCTVSK